MNRESAHLTAARRIRAALNQAANALIDARLDDVLAAEGPLAAAVATWPGPPTAGGADRNQLRLEVVRLRTSLERCRRLGLVLNTFADASLSVSGCARGYDRSGAARSRTVPDARALEARA
jgi:hypothetical protein